jgi:hypothetical protein
VIIVIPDGSFDTSWPTVTGADPVTPSLVPTMFAVPLATPVTVPDAELPATAVLLELNVTVRPVSTLLCSSRVTAVAVVVELGMIDGDSSVTCTCVTGGVINEI